MGKQAVKDFEAASEMARLVVSQAGLTVPPETIPTAYQLGIGVLHTREDAAHTLGVLLNILHRLDKILWWVRAVAVLLFIHMVAK